MSLGKSSQAAATATAAPSQRSFTVKVRDFLTRKLNVTRQELLATEDVNIVTKKRMRIITTLNLIAFLL